MWFVVLDIAKPLIRKEQNRTRRIEREESNEGMRQRLLAYIGEEGEENKHTEREVDASRDIELEEIVAFKTMSRDKHIREPNKPPQRKCE